MDHGEFLNKGRRGQIEVITEEYSDWKEGKTRWDFGLPEASISSSMHAGGEITIGRSTVEEGLACAHHCEV